MRFAVKRSCKLCGRSHLRLVVRPETNYGAFADWELYHCDALEPDEVGVDHRDHIIYFGHEHLMADSMHTARREDLSSPDASP